MSDGLRDIVYPPILGLAYTMFFGLGLKIDVQGGENIPRAGGAVLASNHQSFLDFIFVGLAARPSKRLVRFMAKDAVFHKPVAGQLMRGMHHIPVNRAAGAASYEEAVARLRGGQVVGIFPEATISRSFVLKDMKNGAARMAQAAEVPLIPVALWGGHRIFTKKRKPDWSRGKAISIAVGKPIETPAGADANDLADTMRTRIGELLEGLQRNYPQQPKNEADRWWLPAYLGGAAPTPEEAAVMDAEDAAGRGRDK
ncbi:lysophospholipid acyltransferase family protein [Spongisporangium articulatum]|uniref:Lysophospholipid acyltransferase family protein n=1 Tax=Spongisporangium articulatum TaxID=3362603 RepID=A0ABW8AIM0_9ACTN